jgi:hypothetical protein
MRRKCVSRELRKLIFRMIAENPTWGVSRIHGKLEMLGFEFSERRAGSKSFRDYRSPDSIFSNSEP